MNLPSSYFPSFSLVPGLILLSAYFPISAASPHKAVTRIVLFYKAGQQLNCPIRPQPYVPRTPNSEWAWIRLAPVYEHIPTQLYNPENAFSEYALSL
ncbi:hypothetical protein B0J11DRAFT_535151 [Dendryphion nanum]|uniref:Uncharacterized protein n=1 Tax=Dendryphion nanum TaxID=256645 RepID=A0A9P9DGY8_9PLEO|nr:hypothetical protein B0J11DRAFT_535151 [Dendryphion nanum]